MLLSLYKREHDLNEIESRRKRSESAQHTWLVRRAEARHVLPHALLNLNFLGMILADE